MLIITKTQFADDHLGFRNDILDYLSCGHSRWLSDGDSISMWMRRDESPSIQYNNPLARIEVCEALVEEVDHVVPLESRYWLLSASSRRFGHDPKSGRFSRESLKTLEDWTQRELIGLNYVAAIEGAWYGNYTRIPCEAPRVSFHFHAIAWGAEPGRVKAVADRIETTERPFISGMRVSHHGQRPRVSLDSYVRYIMKAPMNEYRLIDGPGNQGAEATATGRSRPKKRPMRPGAACQMMSVIGYASIADYLLAGGQGIQALETALGVARKRLTRIEARRRQCIERAVWGD